MRFLTALVKSILFLYLLTTALLSLLLLIDAFPEKNLAGGGGLVFPDLSEGLFSHFFCWPSQELVLESGQGQLLLAFLSGVVGSFIASGQSLGAFAGNDSFRSRWAIWYLVRPWLGGSIGLVVFVVMRAGFLSDDLGDVRPFAIVAIAALGGWFSKETADKLRDVLRAILSSGADDDRDGKLVPNAPALSGGGPVAPTEQVRTLTGENFTKGSKATLNGKPYAASRKSANELRVKLPRVFRDSLQGDIRVAVQDGRDPGRRTEEIDVHFDPAPQERA